MLQFLIGTLLVLSSLFLIALVLIQQGKGGGLAGAFGGMGGQSAFGTKAGDVFTRVTIITALVWIFFCMLAIKLISKEGSRRTADSAPPPVTAPANPGQPATGATPAATTPGDAKPGEAKKDDKAAPATTTPDPMAPATTPATPMTPAATTPAAPTESSTPAPAATTPAAPATPEPAAPATPEKK